jgi:hypothetical protein
MHHLPFSTSRSRLLSPRLLAFLSQLIHPATTFTPEEVRLRLQQANAAHPRTQAVHAAAARTGVWSSLLPDKAAFDLGRAANRLPTIVHWYCQGVPLHEIGRRLSPLGGAWDADHALDVATVLIARALNRPELADINYLE